MANGKYSVSTKANADTERWAPALAAVTDGAVVIAGFVIGARSATVSRYDIVNQTW